ncbi:MAG: hypothetical protein CM1200mP29_17310 [Verrucomicrobiota bacterium]|nr:MAG: hypothetical protein CM1200mP29_17310 [Verrucomicrobiota bacterium]
MTALGYSSRSGTCRTRSCWGVIDMDAAGYILPKRGQETNVAGVFVAGDCSDQFTGRQ